MIDAESSTLTFNCPKKGCKNVFSAHIIEHKGGLNDYGWWIIECSACGEIFDTYIGRDVNDSSLSSGGRLLARMDKEVHNEEDVKTRVKKLKEKS
jgi:hypothetical protein